MYLHCHIVTFSHFHIVTLSHCQSHCHIVTMSHCHSYTFRPWPLHTESLHRNGWDCSLRKMPPSRSPSRKVTEHSVSLQSRHSASLRGGAQCVSAKRSTVRHCKAGRSGSLQSRAQCVLAKSSTVRHYKAERSGSLQNRPQCVLAKRSTVRHCKANCRPCSRSECSLSWYTGKLTGFTQDIGLSSH